MARYTIRCADFRDTLAEIEGQADLIATSPPYPDARTCYGSLEWEDYQALGDSVLRALKPGAHCLLNLAAPVRQLRDGHGTERDPMPWRVMLDWIDRVGLTCPDTIAYGRGGVPGKFPGFRCDWEPLLWFRRPGPPRPIFKQRLAEKSPWGVMRKRVASKGGRKDSGEKARASGTIITSGERLPGSFWGYGAVGKAEASAVFDKQNHPARWPYRLAADIVACFSDAGDLVVDPFLGGGTTLCAACDGERRFYGGDLAEEWAAKSRALADARYSQMRLAI